MEVKTKLSIGDKMYIIEKIEDIEPISCVSCEGTGIITFASGNKYACPDCFGKGFRENKVTKAWKIFDDRNPDFKHSIYGKPVGKINIEITKNERKKETDVKIYYSPKGCCNSFFGDSDYFDEENVFGTIEEAQAECNKRNSTIKR